MASDTLGRVVACISRTTRYPTQLLATNADIETDLGIDSVKRVEIVVALGEEFGIELEAEKRDPSIRTIGDIANWVDSFLLQNFDAPEESSSARDPSQGNGHSSVVSRSPELNGSRFENLRISNRATAIETNGQFSNGNGNGSSNGSGNGEVHTTTNVGTNGKPLTGRIALVTGSGRGLGRTVARVLAARGATVVVNSFHSRDQGDETVQQILQQGGKAIHLWGSVAKTEHVDQIFSRIEGQFGGLDFLVCNSSDGAVGSFLELSPGDWDLAFRTNVIGHHHCAQLALPLMRGRGGGSIVTMSAVGAHHYVDGLGSQGVVKAAVESMTKYLASEVARFGIRANCVAGGPVYGDLLDKLPEADVTRNRWEATSPDGELCSPLDIANTIAFLVSDEARGINGAVLTVDHGISASAPGQPVRQPRSFQIS